LTNVAWKSRSTATRSRPRSRWSKRRSTCEPASLQRTARETFEDYEREAKEYASAAEEVAEIKRALETSNGKAAWAILRNRREYEYERVSVTYYDDPEHL
jgi:hypothetical protein